MFRFFETLVNPFPKNDPESPPWGLAAFLYHYSRPVLPWLALMSLLTAVISTVELTFLSFLGSLVNWLAGSERATFFVDHGWILLGMAALVVVGYPILILLQSLLIHQGIFGNYPMIVRWMAHRHMLHQSMAFFQDEFAGRVSQKVMQTALAIRETVMKLADVFVYIVVYFTGAMFLVGRAEPWLMAPLVLWLAAYIGIMVCFVPRLRRVSRAQADARSRMTGRVVDTYTRSSCSLIRCVSRSTRVRPWAASCRRCTARCGW